MATVKLHIFSNLYTAILITFSINLLACKHPLHSCILGAAAASCIQKNHCRLLSFLLVRLGVILQISLSPGLSVLLKGIISSFLQTFCLFVCFFFPKTYGIELNDFLYFKRYVAQTKARIRKTFRVNKIKW